MESLGLAKVYGRMVEVFKNGNRYYFWSASNGRKMPIKLENITF